MQYLEPVTTTDSRDMLYHLAKQCVEDSERWFGDCGKVHDLVHHCLGLAGETGEFIELVKKIDRGSYYAEDLFVQKQLRSELADVFIYVLNLAGILGIDLYEEYNRKREYNEERFTKQRQMREDARALLKEGDIKRSES